MKYTYLISNILQRLLAHLLFPNTAWGRFMYWIHKPKCWSTSLNLKRDRKKYSGVLFSCSYGDEEENSTAQVRWSRVKHCTSIAQNECDVSQETFSLEDDYYARVRAVSANAQSVWTESKTRFSPEFDSESHLPADDDVLPEKNGKYCTCRGTTACLCWKKDLCTSLTLKVICIPMILLGTL